MKQLRDMTEPELQALFHTVAERVKWTLPKGTLFVVLAFEQETVGGGVTQYVSNCDRGTMSQALRETADRFDRQDVVARVEGGPMHQRWAVGDVVQIHPEHDDVFGGSFMLVTEPKPWGAQGFVHTLGRGRAFYRVAFDKATKVGHAAFVPVVAEEEAP